ncbi:M2 family metallopeptidase [Pseudoxanthomonas indica]|uniref:Peptidyl-dipeptidase A n=1 Tax=Pseudoxanthomonas indica TaxID=428993 RepID=A0A1T5LQQ8_9GAMM|nr:M2 family metallopeptidase [Pseudoxanthomonas indica]GGD38209.1 peptidase M20 [Pseudoxanthomonas indica]SKC78252.1 peptidyl-dipeptidase A [Pseudoxanthomonas indica]
MKHRHLLLAIAIGGSLLALSACKKDEPTPASDAKSAPQGETADQFIARVNEEYRAMYPEMTASQWLSNTYINDDSQLLEAKYNERFLAQLNLWIEQARKFEGQKMSPQTARAIQLLKLMTSMPAPKDPAKLAELTQIASRMGGMYGAGKYCTGEGDAQKCRDLGQLEDVLRKSRDYDAQLDAWQGWHSVAQPMRKDYTRFAELVNEGAKELGYADTGEMWRSGYDMTPAEMSAETDRLWGQVKPLYEQLHCYTRTKLQATYGADKGQVNGMLPAHLTGNMWQQDWGNLWDILQPYKNAPDANISDALQTQYQDDYAKELTKVGPSPTSTQLFEADRAAQLRVAKQMTERAQDFYVSMGMPRLPKSYWEKTQFIKPLDRDVVCHASAWDMNMAGDVRTKMCTKPNEEDFTTIYHELGHVYYYLAYNKQPPLFQNGAHDGFHEAIGDTMVLAMMTPEYQKTIGLIGDEPQNHDALINAQMRMALAKVSFMPFGLMIDRWRWGVFDGSIKTGDYNKAWWDLKAKYQGVAPVTARGEDYFDPGAKYHVPGNTPYTRYFLSHILQFQFYKGLCDASGYKGPLYNCSFYGNKVAGQRYWAMLEKGASQPWQDTLKEVTGSDKMDASAVLEYFAPLQDWLKQQNEGQTCGWQPPAENASAAAATPARKQG